jgi:hypothetical protein
MNNTKRRPIDEIIKSEKIAYLRLNGWYELKTKNNWVDGTKIPKNWKGLNLDDAFERFYAGNKRKIF